MNGPTQWQGADRNKWSPVGETTKDSGLKEQNRQQQLNWRAKETAQLALSRMAEASA